jgi:predicted short-subunit dehydrogenase-like oxidoreductase (DUF2520 family)
MEPSRTSPLAIIGPGRLGTAMGILAARAGLAVRLGGRDPRRLDQAARQIEPPPTTGTAAEAARGAALVLLTVSDAAIEPVCRELLAAGALEAKPTLAHCSGALGSESLAPAREAGCAIASMHPMQSFPDAAAAAERFAGTYCFCEGDETALRRLEALARAIGGEPVRIAPEAKTLYHAAAVLACNDLTALLDAALYAAGKVGIDRGTFARAVLPMAAATVANTLQLGAEKALTGPVCRGDAAVIERHLRALAACAPACLELYRAGGHWTVDLARRAAGIDDAQARQLHGLLDSHIPNVLERETP